jgi:multidrug resistance efflux pump
MSSQIDEAEAEILACTVERDELQRTLKRTRQLASTGVVANSRLEEAESIYAAAAANCDAALARYDRLRAEHAAADDGIYLRDGGNDTPYSQQQRDRLMLRRQEVETELLRESARVRQLEEEMTLERARLEDASRYSFLMPASHVVWSVSASPGSTVVEGQSIVDLADCRRRFLSVELPERQVESIRRGDVAQIRLLGSDHWVSGTVEHIRGSAAQTDNRLFAAQLPKPSERQISVDVVLPANTVNPDSSRQCDIGRQAEVRFDRGMPDLFGLVGKAFAGTLNHD